MACALAESFRELLVGLGIIVRVSAVDFGGFDRHRTVDEDSDVGYPALMNERAQIVEDPLRAPKRKHRNDDLAGSEFRMPGFGPLVCAVDRVCKSLQPIPIGVQTIAVSAFANDVISLLDQSGVPETGHALASNVSTEHDSPLT